MDAEERQAVKSVFDDHQHIPLYPGTEFDDCAICALLYLVLDEEDKLLTQAECKHMQVLFDEVGHANWYVVFKETFSISLANSEDVYCPQCGMLMKGEVYGSATQ